MSSNPYTITIIISNSDWQLTTVFKAIKFSIFTTVNKSIAFTNTCDNESSSNFYTKFRAYAYV